MAHELGNLAGQTIRSYELQERIGQGGFGTVYRAYQTAVEREVAIKIILPEHANDPDFIRRFESEARLVARLEHPHIVPLYDYWREPGMACLVMRYLRGGSLQDRIEVDGAWPLNAIAQLLDQVAQGLEVAHRNNIVHRDLKPANILLDEQRNAYVADFGIAKKLTSEAQAPSIEDRYGSPAFISPEQVTGRPVSPQSDIYSLGLVLYVLLTGQAPFPDMDTTTVIRRQVSETLPGLQSVRPDLPYALNPIIWRATSKRPDLRYANALDLAADFRQAIGAAPPLERESSSTFTSVPGGTVSSKSSTVILNAQSPQGNPYKGLKSFQEADASDFFGRGALVERLLARLSAKGRFLAVVGPSGSGKSSVVMAGLIPALKQGVLYGSQNWYYVQITPGSSPINQLAEALLRIATTVPESLLEQLSSSENALNDLILALLPEPDSEMLLVIDQFEELFTLTTDEKERQQTLSLLHKAVTSEQSHLRVIITLRADYYDRPLLYPGFSDLMRDHTEIVTPLSSAEMESAIVNPAERHGVHFEMGLVADIMAAVNRQPGMLPLLQFALTQLYERREGHLLTSEAYEALGGVSGALAKHADEVYDALDSASQSAAQQLFLRLVNPDEAAGDSRRRIKRTELSAITSDRRIMQEVIDVFGRARLLTFDYEPTTRTPTVEIAHEALIRAWGRLKSWIDSNRDELRLHRKLTAATNDWLAAKRDPSFLAAGSRLSELEPLLVSSSLKLTQEESSYLWASAAARQRSIQRTRALLVGLTVFSIVVLILAMFALNRQQAAENERQRADEQARLSQSRELAVSALTGLETPDLNLLLAVAAMNTADTAAARNSLLTNLQQNSAVDRFLYGHTDGIRAVAFSPNGRLMATTGRDRSILLWDAATFQRIGEPLLGHTDWINTLAFTPDSLTLVSAGSAGNIRRWDTRTGQGIGTPLSGAENGVYSLTTSPDGQQIAAGDGAGSIHLWDMSSGIRITRIEAAHSDVVYTLAYTPDGQYLASGGGDSLIRLWDAKTMEPIGEPLAGHESLVLTLAFTPDGTTLASAGVDRNIILWDVPSGTLLDQFDSGHTERIRSLAFSPNGQFMATGSADESVRLWNTETFEPVGEPLKGHAEAVWSVAFSGDSHKLISSSGDEDTPQHSRIVWNLEAVPALMNSAVKRNSDVLAVAVSPDGSHIATAGGIESGDSSIQIVDMVTGEPSILLTGHERYVTGLVYSPDGRSLISASADGTVRIWDLGGSQLRRTLTLPVGTRELVFVALAISPEGSTIAAAGDNQLIALWDTMQSDPPRILPQNHTDSILALAFSPDGKTLASAGWDKTILLWDVPSGTAHPVQLNGHTDAVMTLAFAPDGNRLISGSRDGTIRVWDLSSPQPTSQVLRGHNDWITAVAISSDGQFFASGSLDRTVILWDLTSLQRVGKPLAADTDWITSLAVAQDNRTMLMGTQDGQAVTWNIDTATWKQQACKIANRDFSPGEWARFFGDQPFRPTCLTS
jgi:WD40 repeat protein/serine/threonine protein kinase/energy-coupling factor transporter ATP-binding protein EcfA2